MSKECAFFFLLIIKKNCILLINLFCVLISDAKEATVRTSNIINCKFHL